MRTVILTSGCVRIDTRARKAAARMRTHTCASTHILAHLRTLTHANAHVSARANTRAKYTYGHPRTRMHTHAGAAVSLLLKQMRTRTRLRANACANARASTQTRARTPKRVRRRAGADPCERPARAAERGRLGDELGADDPFGGIREGVRVRAQSEPGLVLRRVLPGARVRTCYLGYLQWC